MATCIGMAKGCADVFACLATPYLCSIEFPLPSFVEALILVSSISEVADCPDVKVIFSHAYASHPFLRNRLVKDALVYLQAALLVYNWSFLKKHQKVTWSYPRFLSGNQKMPDTEELEPAGSTSCQACKMRLLTLVNPPNAEGQSMKAMREPFPYICCTVQTPGPHDI